MRFLYYYILFSKILRPNHVFDKINQILHLPSWQTPSEPCHHDRDCPPPYACCHDPFFPVKNKFCCIYYKNRSYEPIYALNYIQP
jgi:hypothetical protein